MVYKFKSSDAVQSFLFNDFSQLIEDIIESYKDLRVYDIINVYATNTVAYEIVKQLIKNCDEMKLGCLSRDDVLAKECVITISYDGMVVMEDARGVQGRFKLPEEALNYFYDGLLIQDLKSLMDADSDAPILVFGFNEE